MYLADPRSDLADITGYWIEPYYAHQKRSWREGLLTKAMREGRILEVRGCEHLAADEIKLLKRICKEGVVKLEKDAGGPVKAAAGFKLLLTETPDPKAVAAAAAAAAESSK